MMLLQLLSPIMMGFNNSPTPKPTVEPTPTAPATMPRLQGLSADFFTPIISIRSGRRGTFSALLEFAKSTEDPVLQKIAFSVFNAHQQSSLLNKAQTMRNLVTLLKKEEKARVDCSRNTSLTKKNKGKVEKLSLTDSVSKPLRNLLTQLQIRTK